MSMSGKTTVFLRSNHTGHFLLHHRSGYISCVLLSLVVLLFILTTNGVQIQEQDDETIVTVDIATVPNNMVMIEDSIFFEILWPESLRYTYKIRQAKDFGTMFSRNYKNVELIMADPIEGCQELNNNVRDAVVLILRGECSFITKTRVAERAGAIAAIIADNDESNDSSMVDMIDDETKRAVDIPSAFLLGKDGLMIRRHLGIAGSDYALVNIPLNLTGKPMMANKRPPWTVW